MVLKNLFRGQQWRNRHREQTYGHGERGGEGGTNGESGIETCILPYAKQIANGSSPYVAGSSNLVLCDNLEVWDGVGSGREVQEEGDMCIAMVDSY